MSLLQGLRPSHISAEPFPHIVFQPTAKLPPWPEDFRQKALASGRVQGRADAVVRLRARMIPDWHKFHEVHTSKAFFDEVVRLFRAFLPSVPTWPGVRRRPGLPGCDAQLIENPPGAQNIQPMHRDSATELYTCLWYRKHPDDDSSGGNLLLHDSRNEPVKAVPYDKNTAVLMLNTQVAFHSVLPRVGEQVCRRYLCIASDLPKPLFP